MNNRFLWTVISFLVIIWFFFFLWKFGIKEKGESEAFLHSEAMQELQKDSVPLTDFMSAVVKANTREELYKLSFIVNVLEK